MINAEMDKLETEKQSQKAEEERLRHEREEREKLRAEKLKEMRAYLEQKSFDEIYPEYSKILSMLSGEVCAGSYPL